MYFQEVKHVKSENFIPNDFLNKDSLEEFTNQNPNYLLVYIVLKDSMDDNLDFSDSNCEQTSIKNLNISFHFNSDINFHSKDLKITFVTNRFLYSIDLDSSKKSKKFFGFTPITLDPTSAKPDEGDVDVLLKYKFNQGKFIPEPQQIPSVYANLFSFLHVEDGRNNQNKLMLTRSDLTNINVIDPPNKPILGIVSTWKSFQAFYKKCENREIELESQYKKSVGKNVTLVKSQIANDPCILCVNGTNSVYLLQYLPNSGSPSEPLYEDLTKNTIEHFKSSGCQIIHITDSDEIKEEKNVFDYISITHSNNEFKHYFMGELNRSVHISQINSEPSLTFPHKESFINWLKWIKSQNMKISLSHYSRKISAEGISFFQRDQKDQAIRFSDYNAFFSLDKSILKNVILEEPNNQLSEVEYHSFEDQEQIDLILPIESIYIFENGKVKVEFYKSKEVKEINLERYYFSKISYNENNNNNVISYSNDLIILNGIPDHYKIKNAWALDSSLILLILHENQSSKTINLYRIPYGFHDSALPEPFYSHTLFDTHKEEEPKPEQEDDNEEGLKPDHKDDDKDLLIHSSFSKNSFAIIISKKEIEKFEENEDRFLKSCKGEIISLLYNNTNFNKDQKPKENVILVESIWPFIGFHKYKGESQSNERVSNEKKEKNTEKKKENSKKENSKKESKSHGGGIKHHEKKGNSQTHKKKSQTKPKNDKESDKKTESKVKISESFSKKISGCVLSPDSTYLYIILNFNHRRKITIKREEKNEENSCSCILKLSFPSLNIELTTRWEENYLKNFISPVFSYTKKGREKSLEYLTLIQSENVEEGKIRFSVKDIGVDYDSKIKEIYALDNLIKKESCKEKFQFLNSNMIALISDKKINFHSFNKDQNLNNQEIKSSYLVQEAGKRHFEKDVHSELISLIGLSCRLPFTSVFIQYFNTKRNEQGITELNPKKLNMNELAKYLVMLNKKYPLSSIRALDHNPNFWPFFDVQPKVKKDFCTPFIRAFFGWPKIIIEGPYIDSRKNVKFEEFKNIRLNCNPISSVLPEIRMTPLSPLNIISMIDGGGDDSSLLLSQLVGVNFMKQGSNMLSMGSLSLPLIDEKNTLIIREGISPYELQPEAVVNEFHSFGLYFTTPLQSESQNTTKDFESKKEIMIQTFLSSLRCSHLICLSFHHYQEIDSFFISLSSTIPNKLKILSEKVLIVILCPLPADNAETMEVNLEKSLQTIGNQNQSFNEEFLKRSIIHLYNSENISRINRPIAKKIIEDYGSILFSKEDLKRWVNLSKIFHVIHEVCSCSPMKLEEISRDELFEEVWSKEFPLPVDRFWGKIKKHVLKLADRQCKENYIIMYVLSKVSKQAKSKKNYPTFKKRLPINLIPLLRETIAEFGAIIDYNSQTLFSNI